MSFRRVQTSVGCFFVVLLLFVFQRWFSEKSLAELAAADQRRECVKKCTVLRAKTRATNQLFIRFTETGFDNKIIQQKYDKRHRGLSQSLVEYQQQLDRLQINNSDIAIRDALDLLVNDNWLNQVDALCKYGLGGDINARLDDLAALRKSTLESCDGCR